MNYLPSILATVTMLHVIKEVDPCNQLESQNQLMAVLKTNEVRMLLTWFLCFIAIQNRLFCEQVLDLVVCWLILVATL